MILSASRTLRRNRRTDSAGADAARLAAARHFFGAELRHWRQLADLSHDRLGAQINYSGDTIGKVEKAERAPTAALATACDQVLGTGGALARLVALIEATALGDPHRSFSGYRQRPETRARMRPERSRSYSGGIAGERKGTGEPM